MKPLDQLSYRGQVWRLRRLAAAALPAYGLGPTRMRLVGHGYNTTFRVDGPAPLQPADPAFVPGRFLLRVHRAEQHDASLDRLRAIESELAWLAALRAETALGVPEPVPTLDGRFVIRCEAPGVAPRFCTLLRWLDGRPLPAEPPVEQLGAVGELMAQLHAHARSWPPPGGFVRVRWDWESFFGRTASYAGLTFSQALALIPSVHRPMFERVPALLRAAMGALGEGPEAWGLIHADLHCDNLLVAGGAVRPIDFDDCGFGYLVYDMAVALWLLRDKAGWPAYRDAFFAGYSRHRPLPAEQLRHLDLFIAAREALIGLWVAAEARRNPAFGEGLDNEIAGAAQLIGRLLDGAP